MITLTEMPAAAVKTVLSRAGGRLSDHGSDRRLRWPQMPDGAEESLEEGRCGHQNRQ
ncbi:hypothetical protein O7A70_33235 [Mesorhizobium sp. Cs1299R1N1]|uniref:hypothetical protein n=1 Tax=Mesorhizobium sp. Cs1299R1N1 TaxID=3015172 RepID=UPI00301C29EE